MTPRLVGITCRARSDSRSQLDKMDPQNRKKWMKSWDLTNECTLELVYNDSHTSIETFEFLAAGANRVVYASRASATILKLHPLVRTQK